jgi:hypothetical protein
MASSQSIARKPVVAPSRPPHGEWSSNTTPTPSDTMGVGSPVLEPHNQNQAYQPQHSTLEVAPVTYDPMKETVRSEDYPHALPPEHQYYGAGGYVSVPGQGNEPVPEERKIMGMKKRTFVILAVVLGLLIVLGAGLGGGLGATLGKNNASAESPKQPGAGGNGTTTPPIPTGLFATSRLAAVNYTDTSRNNWYAVFYQDQWTALIVSVFNPTTKEWTIQNISGTISQAGGSIKPMAGTPIAAAAKAAADNFQMNIYYISEEGSIGEFVTTDIAAKTWSIGTLPTTAKKIPRKGSQLGAAWHQCASSMCSKAPLVVFQETDQRLRMSNGTDWSKDQFVFNGMTPLTPIAFFPHGQNYSFLRVYADQSNTLQEFMWGDGVFGVTGFWYGKRNASHPLAISPSNSLSFEERKTTNSPKRHPTL